MSFYGKIKQGIIALYDKAFYDKEIQKFKDGQEIEVTVEILRDRRTSQLNRYYWKVIVEQVADITGYDKQDIHDYLKTRFNRRQVTFGDKTYTIVGSTSDLTTSDFLSFIDKCYVWATESFPESIFPEEESYNQK